MSYPLQDSNVWQELDRRARPPRRRSRRRQGWSYRDRLDRLAGVCEQVLALIIRFYPTT